MSSFENRVLNDLRANDLWHTAADFATRAALQCDYLESDFGTEALNDGIYTAEEIEAALPVLRRLA